MTTQPKALSWDMVVSSPQYGEKYNLFPVFPLAGSTAKAFFRLFLWSFKKKSINHFYNTAFWKGPVMVRDCAIMQQNNHQGLILGDNWSP